MYSVCIYMYSLPFQREKKLLQQHSLSEYILYCICLWYIQSCGIPFNIVCLSKPFPFSIVNIRLVVATGSKLSFEEK